MNHTKCEKINLVRKEYTLLGKKVMSDTSFKQEIKNLIALGIEGNYWDFKEEWHSNNVCLLHDILCMANNLENRDSYIIIGVNNNGIICGVPDTNRKNQQNLIDVLKDKKFAGGIRPIVYVKTLDLEKQIDVIIIKNSMNVPYYLTDDFQGIYKGNIYTRVGDTNTPKTLTADVDKVEYLWRKRFGLDLSPLEKAIFLLRNPKNWLPIGTYGQHSSSQYNGQYYHKQFPEFNLKYRICESRFVQGRIDSVEHEIYWMNKLPSPLHNAYIYTLDVNYHSTALYSTLAIFADNDRFTRVLWKNKILLQNASNEYISYCYIEKDSIEFMLDNWLCNSHDTIPQIEEYSIINPLEPWVSQPDYKVYNPYNVVPIFENVEEHKAYREYIKGRKSDFLTTIGDYSFSNSQYKSTHAKYNAPDYIEYLCKSGETLVRWLDEWRELN